MPSRRTRKKANKRKRLAGNKALDEQDSSAGNSPSPPPTLVAPESDPKDGPTGSNNNNNNDNNDSTSNSNNNGNSQSSLCKRSRPGEEEEAGGETGGQAGDECGEWQEVGRQAKRKKKDRYPTLKPQPVPAKAGRHVRITDLRDLVLYMLGDGQVPQWIKVSNRAEIKKVVCVMVPGLEDGMFRKDVDLDEVGKSTEAAAAATSEMVDGPDGLYPRTLVADHVPAPLRPLVSRFPDLWTIQAGGDDKGTRVWPPAESFLSVPAPKKNDRGRSNSVTKMMAGWKNEPVRITELLATLEECEQNKFLVHPAMRARDGGVSLAVLPAGWVATRVDRWEDGDVPEDEIEQGSVTAGRNVLSIDCEMCMTGPDEYSLTRISILDWAGNTVLDELVKPDKPITNYVTQFSGITRAMLEPVTTTLGAIQDRLLDLFTARTIVVGHSLDSDLKACQITHPFLVDTALIYQHPRGPPLKASLKWLANRFLAREIQKGDGDDGHDSIEDAKASLDLVREKCERGKRWGVQNAPVGSLFIRLARAGLPKGVADALQQDGGGGSGGAGLGQGKSSALVDWGDQTRGIGAKATHGISCWSDDEVTDGIIRAINGDPDGRVIRAGGVDFVWAHMRELEAIAGWPSADRVEAAVTEAIGSAVAAVEAASAGSGQSPLVTCLAAVSDRLERVHNALPPCSAMLVISGTGNPGEMGRLREMRAAFRREYTAPGATWDKLSVQWTDAEDQELMKAIQLARMGIGFMGIK